MVPLPHNGQGLPMILSSGWRDLAGAVLETVLLFGAELFLLILFFRSSSVVTVTCRLLLSVSTSFTIADICAFSSSINWDASYFLCSMSRNFFSQIPVSSQLFNSSSCIVSISSMRSEEHTSEL